MKKYFIVLFILHSFSVIARVKYDSVAWYDKTHLSFVRTDDEGRIIEYAFHPNGHVSSITHLSNGQLIEKKTYSQAGKIIFDTARSANYYNWSWSYYPDGSKKRFVQDQLTASSWQTHTGFELIEWDQQGSVSRAYFKDDKGKLVADLSYPFRQFRNLRCHRVYFANDLIKEHGFYVMDPLSGTMKKYGAWITFHPNGQLESAGLYMNDVPWGLHYTFDSTGAQTSLRNYVQGREVDFASDQLTLQSAAGSEAPAPYWRWNNFTNEGLYSYNGSHVYFYRGCALVDIRELGKLKRDNPRDMQFHFPYMPFWSTWNKYTVTCSGATVVRETEEVNGSWYNRREYNYAGQLTVSTTGSRSEEITYHANGRRSSLMKFLRYNYQPRHYFNEGTDRQDTSFYWNYDGVLTRMEVYGLYGQLQYTIDYTDDSVRVLHNPLYNRVFIQPGSENRTFEALDADVLLPGKVSVINGKNIEVLNGEFLDGRNGLWVTRHAENGYVLVKEHYRNGEGKAPGKYREYHENGKLKTTGRYGEDQQEVGIWKEYNDKGRLISRVRYLNNRIVGFEYCASCCRKKNGGYRNLLKLHLGQRSLSFGPCYPDKRNPYW